MPAPTAAPIPGVHACVFCGTTHGKLTREHVIPQWARRSFNIKGPVTVHAREEGLSQRRQVGAMQALNITLDDVICENCNSVWLSRLERRVKPLLAPMAVSAQPTTLSPASQHLIATWAVKAVLLLELALRQIYPGSRPVQGYEASPPELAWLRARSEPPPRSRVWLGCWDCQQTVPVRYAPSSALLPTLDGSRSRAISPPSPWDTSRSRCSPSITSRPTSTRLPPGTTTCRHRWRRRSQRSGRSFSGSRTFPGPRRRSPRQPGTGSSPGTVPFAQRPTLAS
jgi:hypothetical protein